MGVKGTSETTEGGSKEESFERVTGPEELKREVEEEEEGEGVGRGRRPSTLLSVLLSVLFSVFGVEEIFISVKSSEKEGVLEEVEGGEMGVPEMSCMNWRALLSSFWSGSCL